MPQTTQWIAVPTYWTSPAGKAGEEQVVFDHPTPLDAEGTVCRAIESFRTLEGDFNVVVLLGLTNPLLAEEAHEKVERLLRPYSSDFPVYLVSPHNLSAFTRALQHPILRLDSYGNIRNVQLAVPFAAGAEAVIGIDDDEVIEDAGFMEKVRRFLGSELQGEYVGGMAGPYFDRKGDYQIPGADELASEPNVFIKKNYYMNKNLKKAMEGAPEGGIVRSNVAFGGNMCMTRSTIKAVCHDPYIPRGEDYDYVINAKMRGISFFFQPRMSIIHLPPDSTGSQAADKETKLVADIRRFIYMREKHKYHRRYFPQEVFDIEYLMPYPGVYLDENLDLAKEGVEALDRLYPGYRDRASPEVMIQETVETAKDRAEDFFRYRNQWYLLMKELEENTKAKEAAESFRLG